MKKSIVVFLGFLITSSVSLFAQTPATSPLDPIITRFNIGAGLVNSGDFKGAIAEFEVVITMADEVGSSANDLKTKAQNQLPILHYQVATSLLKQKKYEEAVTYLEKTVQLAENSGNNQSTKEKAFKLLPTILFQVGFQKYKEKNNTEALKYYQSAINYDPNNDNAYLGIGIIYADTNDEQKMVTNLQKAIEIGTAMNDIKTIETAQRKLSGYYVNIGNIDLSEVESENPDYSFAIKNFEKAISYDPKASDAYYALASIYNKTLEFDKAIINGNKALENETQEIKLALINYELGTAYTNTAEYEKACEALKKAMVGDLTERAQLKIEKVPGCIK